MLGRPRARLHRPLKLILFGASGMVGSGVLREALADPEVTAVLSVARRPSGAAHPKLSELVVPDLFQIPDEPRLSGWDACVWAVGVSSVGMDEGAYARLTEELTLLWAQALLRLNPGLSFCYCSAMGADGSGMWPRVRRRVEGALKTLGFRHAGSVRPGLIEPGPGIVSKVALYQVFISLFRPLFPLLVRLFPGACTTSERLGRAMLAVVKGRAGGYILEPADINRVGAAESRKVKV